MKNFLLPLCLLVTLNTAFGQVQHNTNTLISGKSYSFTGNKPRTHLLAKSTAANDTLYYYNNTDTLLFDSSVALRYDGITPNDTGYLFGTNVYGDSAFAEMYDFTWGTDSTVSVLGLLSYWGGSVNPASTDSVTFHVWGIDSTKYQLDTNIYAGNFPGASMGSQKVALTALNIGSNQLATTWFDAPVAGINSNFYVGYSYSYDPTSLNGDTITLRSTPNGKGSGTGQYDVDNNGDTLLITRNAVMETDGYWYDVYNDYSYNVNLSIVPIFKLQQATAIHGIGNSGLALTGSVPNPAANSTSISFTLQQGANVTIQLADLNGKILSTQEQRGLNPGSHSVSISLAQYPSGNYIYIIRSDKGAAMAALLTIEK